MAQEGALCAWQQTHMYVAAESQAAASPGTDEESTWPVPRAAQLEAPLATPKQQEHGQKAGMGKHCPSPHGTLKDILKRVPF